MDALTKWSVTATKAKARLTFKQLALVALACVGGLAASSYGYYWWTTGRFIESTDDAYVGGNVTPISPHIAGFIADILVTDNQRVDAGQVLVRLDDRDVRAAADHAQAVLNQRAAMLASLRAKYALQQATVEQAGADLDAKTAQAGFARQEAERYRTLALSDYGSRQNAERTFAQDQAARSARSDFRRIFHRHGRARSRCGVCRIRGSARCQPVNGSRLYPWQRYSRMDWRRRASDRMGRTGDASQSLRSLGFCSLRLAYTRAFRPI